MQNEKFRILVVDDVASSRELLAKELREAGYAVDTAVSGEEAIERVCQAGESFDFILMDQVLMGGMDGIEATRIICETHPQIRTIVMTIYGDGDSSRGALDAGAYRYVFRSVDLTEAVRDVVELIESADELAQIEEKMAESFLLNGVLKDVSVATGIVDRTYRVLYANEAQNEVGGGKAHPGGICWVEWHQAVQQKEPCSWCPVKPLFEEQEAEVKLVPLIKGDNLRYWQTSASPIRNQGGQTVAALKWGLDVTERELARQATMEAHTVDERLEAALDQIRMLGYSRASLYELSEDGTVLVERTWVGKTDRSTPRGHICIGDYQHARGALARNLPVICTLHESRHSLFRAWMEQERIEEWLEVPLITSQGQAVGLICIDNKIVDRVRPDRPPLPRPITEDHFEPLLTIADFAANSIWEAREHERTVRQLALQRQLREIDAEIAQVLEMAPLLQSIVKRAVQLLDASGGSLFLCDHAKKQVSIAVSYRLDEPLKGMTFAFGEGVAGNIAQTKQPLIVNDYYAWPGRSPQLDAIPYRNLFNAIAGVPIVWQNKVIGVLNISARSAERIFVPHDTETLESFASRAAIAIENARLFEELHERASQLRQLLTITNIITADPSNLKDVSRSIVTTLSDIFYDASCAIRLYDPATDRFRPQEAVGVIRGWIDHDPRPDGTTRHVLRNMKPRYLEGSDLESPNDGGPAVRKDILDLGVKAVAYLPLLSRKEVAGVLYVNLTVHHRFSANDKLLLELFANQAAIAIENARLITELQDRVDELSALDQMSQGLSSKDPLSLPAMSELLYQTSRELMDLSNFYVASYDRTRNRVEFEFVVVDGKETQARDGEWAPRTGGNGLTEYVVREGTFLYIEKDVAHWREQHKVTGGLRDGLSWDEWSKLPAATTTERSWLGVPIRVGEEVLGVIGVQNYDKSNAYDEHDQEILSTMTAQLGIAIVRQQLTQRNKALDRRNAELEVLTEIGRTVSSLGIDQIVDLVYDSMGRIMDLSDAQVQFAFYDEAKYEVSFPLAIEQDNGEIIDVVRWSKREAQYRKPNEEEIVEQFRPRARREPPGLNEYVIRSKEPLLIVEDFEQTAEEKGIRVWPTFGRLNRPTDSWLGVPMVVGRRVTGVISIQSLEQEHAFDQDHVRVLTTIAAQAAVATENAKLYDTLEEQVEERTRQLREAQERARAAERLSLMSEVAAEFAHRMNNLAGTIPVRINLAKEGLDSEDPKDAQVIRQL